MKPPVDEWVGKVEADFLTMERECRVRKSPNFDAVCFHAQQCAEKYLKARLCGQNVAFAKIHDLSSLLDQVLPFEPLWEGHRKALSFLTDFAVSYRYPGAAADGKSGRDARAYCRAFRLAARRALGLPSIALRRRKRVARRPRAR